MYHVPVLLDASVEALVTDPNGVYVDATMGGAGHSRAILQQLGPEGRLYAFDQDEDAVRNAPEDKRCIFIPHNFRFLEQFLRLEGVREIHGLLADLGVSSHQFDEAERGFSFRLTLLWTCAWTAWRELPPPMCSTVPPPTSSNGSWANTAR